MPGITLSRNADTQYGNGSHVPADPTPVPGDLVFYGTPKYVDHVGLYIGAGLMIDASDVGRPVESEPYTEKDYLGAIRPSSTARA